MFHIQTLQEHVLIVLLQVNYYYYTDPTLQVSMNDGDPP